MPRVLLGFGQRPDLDGAARPKGRQLARELEDGVIVVALEQVERAELFGNVGERALGSDCPAFLEANGCPRPQPVVGDDSGDVRRGLVFAVELLFLLCGGACQAPGAS